MSTQRTGYIEVPGFKGLLGVREDGAAIQAGGINYTMPAAADTLAGIAATQTLTNKTLTSPTITSPTITTATNVGTVTTAATTTATEYGNAIEHLTVLTMTAFAVGTSADNAALAIGAKFYTWPSGFNILVESTAISGGVTAAISVTTDTPELGIGTVIASTATATLSTTTWENLVDGGASGSSVDAAAVAPDVAGTVFHKKNLTTVQPIIKASGGAARDLFLNAAVTWADVAAVGAVTFTGTITIKWRILS